MENGENKNVDVRESEDLANDVAQLYSLAHVGDVHYRTFQRQRRPQAPAQLSEVSKPDPPSPPAQTAATSVEVPVAPAPQPPVVTPPVIPDSPPVQPLIPPSEHHGIFTEETLHGEGEEGTALAVYSLAGGVGKTTVTANLGRILASLNERVLLVDSSGSGLLPFYFGAGDLRCGLRTFVAPDTNYPPMQVLGAEEITAKWLENDVKAAMKAAQRTIFDLGPASMSLLPEILEMCTVLLIPILTDLNSILTVSRIEASIKAMRDKGLNIPVPIYVSNKFEADSPMEQQARNLVLRQVGDRLLPLTIRRSPDVAAAIRDRMTVADHSPDAEVTHDFMELALWLRKVAPVHQFARFTGQWSER